MMRKIYASMFFMMACVPLLWAGLEGDRVQNGWGFSEAISTTADYKLVEQAPNSNGLANGTFTDATGWTTSGSAVGTFTVAGGKATLVSFDSATQSMYYSFTDITDPVPDKDYDVTFTIAGATATNKVRFLTGIDGTGSTSQWYTSAGTFSTRLTYAQGTNDVYTNFTMQGISMGISTVTVDDVAIRLKPERAWLGQLQAEVKPTDVPAYIYLDCSATDFANAYTVGQTICVTSNRAVTIDLNNTGRKISKIYYRSASGAPTLTLSGW